MAQVEQQAFDARIGLHQLAREANVSSTIITRWKNDAGTPTLPTIGRLEKALTALIGRAG